MRADGIRPEDERDDPAGPSGVEGEGKEGHEGEPAPAELPPIPLPSSGLNVLNADDLDDDDEDDGDEFDDEEETYDDEMRAVLITGASGNIGRKLRAAWEGFYDLVLIDKEPDADPDSDVIVADLAEFDEGWITHFHGVDTVIHLAANPNDSAAWEDLVGPNMDTLANVLNAAALASVERVIFASSNHAMGGYRDVPGVPITVDLPPKPDGPYGGTKLVGERIGKSLAKAFNVTFVALRIGWNQHGANHPSTLPDDWSKSIWLSDGDMVRLFECAVEADLAENQFVVVNGVSNNRGTRWDLTTAADLLGFTPQDDAYAPESVPE